MVTLYYKRIEFICNIDIQATGVRYINTVLPQSTEHSINRTILSVARSSNAHLCTEIIPDYTGAGLGRFPVFDL